MKNKKKFNSTRIIICLFLITIICGCADFLTDINNVESDKIRVLDFIYDPAEALPGDTVRLTAIFSGKKFDANNIVWNISLELSGNGFSVDSASNIRPLEYTLVDTSFSENTYTVALDFIVPESTLLLSPMIPQYPFAYLPKDFAKKVPSDLVGINKAGLLSFVESIIEIPIPDEYNLLMPPLLQILTARLRLFANINNGEMNIESDYTVRYNSAFSYLPTIFENTNPIIKEFGFYKVNGSNHLAFNPKIHTQKYTYIKLYDLDSGIIFDTIEIDTGYTYFVCAKSNSVDTVIVLSFLESEQESSDIYTTEEHLFNWFFKYTDSDVDNVLGYDLPNVSSGKGGNTEFFEPSSDKRIRTFSMWVQVYDYYIGERYRPDASTLAEAQGVFTYTTRYLDSLKK